MAVIKEAYFDDNTPELREWLRSQGLIPIAHPDCDSKPGLTAPYCDRYYNDGRRYDSDDDADTFVICYDEEEFKDIVLTLIKRS